MFKNYLFVILLVSCSKIGTNANMFKTDPILRKQIWSGHVPVLFSMSPNDIISNKDPISIFLLLPRISYLPLFFDKIHKHFAPHAPLSNEIWFESNKCALKWTSPIGVLYDLYIYKQNANHDNKKLNDPKKEVKNNDPVWKLTVHFQSYPLKDTLQCNKTSMIRDTFFNSLKQAIFLAYNSINVFDSLKKEAHITLWDSICKAEYPLYSSVHQSLFNFSNKNNKMMRYPFRIILNGFNDLSNDDIDLIPIQRPIEVEIYDNKIDKIIKLENCLNNIVPGIMEMYYKQKEINIDIIIQGMKIPLNTPMMWLIQHATYADGFLYIIIVKSYVYSRSLNL